MRFVFLQNGIGKFQLFDSELKKWEDVVFDDVKKPQKRNVSSVIRIFSNQAVRKNGKWGIYSLLKKTLIIPCIFDQIIYDHKERFNDGWVVLQNDKWGLLSIDGSVVLPCEYDEILSASYAWLIKKEGRWGTYDNKEKHMGLPCIYNEIIVTPHEYRALNGKEWLIISR